MGTCRIQENEVKFHLVSVLSQMFCQPVTSDDGGCRHTHTHTISYVNGLIGLKRVQMIGWSQARTEPKLHNGVCLLSPLFCFTCVHRRMWLHPLGSPSQTRSSHRERRGEIFDHHGTILPSFAKAGPTNQRGRKTCFCLFSWAKCSRLRSIKNKIALGFAKLPIIPLTSISRALRNRDLSAGRQAWDLWKSSQASEVKNADLIFDAARLELETQTHRVGVSRAQMKSRRVSGWPPFDKDRLAVVVFACGQAAAHCGRPPAPSILLDSVISILHVRFALKRHCDSSAVFYSTSCLTVECAFLSCGPHLQNLNANVNVKPGRRFECVISTNHDASSPTPCSSSG